VEIADDRRCLLRGHVAVLEPQPPHADDRLAAVEDVGWAVGQVKVICQVRPILLDGPQRPGAVHARKVVHDKETAVVRLGARSCVAQHGIEIPLKVRMGDVRQEPLHGGAVDAVLLHPREMTRDGLWVLVGEQKGRRAGGQVEGGRAAFVRIELGGVRPQIDRQRVRVPRIAPAAKPMAPPDADGAIAGAGEPALIAGDVDTAQRRVEMGRPTRRLGPRRARRNDHERLQKQGDASTGKTQPTRPAHQQ
jgi:hypothetical protein